MNTKSIITIVLFAMSSSAFAMDGYSIKVGRDYQVTANTGAVTSVAIGEHVRTDINAGGIQVETANVSIDRDYKVDVKTGAITSVGIGKNISARTNVGGIQQSRQP